MLLPFTARSRSFSLLERCGQLADAVLQGMMLCKEMNVQCVVFVCMCVCLLFPAVIFFDICRVQDGRKCHGRPAWAGRPCDACALQFNCHECMEFEFGRGRQALGSTAISLLDAWLLSCPFRVAVCPLFSFFCNFFAISNFAGSMCRAASIILRRLHQTQAWRCLGLSQRSPVESDYSPFLPFSLLGKTVDLSASFAANHSPQQLPKPLHWSRLRSQFVFSGQVPAFALPVVPAGRKTFLPDLRAHFVPRQF